MGFTIEDMLVVSQNRYHMELIAGKDGWSNSISWLLMLEDITLVQRFTGKELAVTTGLGFPSEDNLQLLCQELVLHQASGLIINIGEYVKKIPDSLIHFCDENSLPLLTVPWDVEIAEMIKDLSIRVFLQGTTDEQISQAFITALEEPNARDRYEKALLPHFDVDGSFQVILLHRPGLDEMDTVERKRLGYRLQLALTNLSHNGHFFYYDSYFVIIMNAVSQSDSDAILENYVGNIERRLPGSGFVIGVGSRMYGIRSLQFSYRRAIAAIRAGESGEVDCPKKLTRFDDLGLYRLLYMTDDQELLVELSQHLLEPLLTYDKEKGGDYVATLENYLKFNGSIRQVSDVMFIHRNTISYRITQIKKMLGTDLSDGLEQASYLLACMITHLY